MGDAMQWLRQMPFGSALYICVAAGLAAFGIYNLIEARYRTIPSPSLSAVTQSVRSALPGDDSDVPSPSDDPTLKKRSLPWPARQSKTLLQR